MPGLTPGAAIDVEYTVRHAPAALRADFQFSFGSTNYYPVERSRLIVLANEDEDVRFATGRNVPRAVIIDHPGARPRALEWIRIAKKAEGG